MPDDEGEGETSEHLSSRFEVGRFCRQRDSSFNLALWDDRQSGGSSLKILINLVRRLPIGGLPSWSTS